MGGDWQWGVDMPTPFTSCTERGYKSKTAFARMLLMFFYKKEELKGKRLTELDQDIVHAIAGW